MFFLFFFAYPFLFFYLYIYIFPKGIVCAVDKIRFFKGQVKSKAKFHLSLGHTTVMCTATFFGSNDHASFSVDTEYRSMEELFVAGEEVAGGDDGTYGSTIYF